MVPEGILLSNAVRTKYSQEGGAYFGLVKIQHLFAKGGLRRCVRACTRAICGACAHEKHSETRVQCACLRLIFGPAMCDHTFAHFL